MTKYKDLFKADVGTVTEYKARLVVDPQSTLKFYKPRAVPYALKAAIEADLERMVKAGILEPVSSSEWASPIVAVPKSMR